MSFKITTESSIEIVSDEATPKTIAKEITDVVTCEVFMHLNLKQIAAEEGQVDFEDAGIVPRILVLYTENPIHIAFGGDPDLYVRTMYVATYEEGDGPDYIYLKNNVGSGSNKVRMIVGGDAA